MKRLAQHRRKDTDSPTSLVRALLVLLRSDRQASRSVPALAARLSVDIMRVRSICDVLHGLKMLSFDSDGSLKLNSNFSLKKLQPLGSSSALVEEPGYSSSGDERDDSIPNGQRIRRGSFDSLLSSNKNVNGVEDKFCKSIERSKRSVIAFSRASGSKQNNAGQDSDTDTEIANGHTDKDDEYDEEEEEERKLDAASVLHSLTGKPNGPSGKSDMDVFCEHIGTIQMRKRQRLLEQCIRFTKHKISMYTQSSGQEPYMQKHLYVLPRDIMQILASDHAGVGVNRDPQLLLLRGPSGAELRVHSNSENGAKPSYQMALISPHQQISSFLLKRDGLTDLFRVSAVDEKQETKNS